MPEYFRQHQNRNWKLWNLPQYLNVPTQDIGMWGIPFAKRCDMIPQRLILPLDFSRQTGYIYEKDESGRQTRQIVEVTYGI